jgi:hypothetical protein
MGTKMTPDKVMQELVSVLQTIQTNSGLACPPLTGSVKPIDDLEGFGSPVWLSAITMLATALDITIPDDVNIFATGDGEIPLSLDETTALVCEIVRKTGKVTEAAE